MTYLSYGTWKHLVRAWHFLYVSFWHVYYSMSTRVNSMTNRKKRPALCFTWWIVKNLRKNLEKTFFHQTGVIFVINNRGSFYEIKTHNAQDRLLKLCNHVYKNVERGQRYIIILHHYLVKIIQATQDISSYIICDIYRLTVTLSH